MISGTTAKSIFTNFFLRWPKVPLCCFKSDRATGQRKPNDRPRHWLSMESIPSSRLEFYSKTFKRKAARGIFQKKTSSNIKKKTVQSSSTTMQETDKVTFWMMVRLYKALLCGATTPQEKSHGSTASTAKQTMHYSVTYPVIRLFLPPKYDQLWLITFWTWSHTVCTIFHPFSLFLERCSCFHQIQNIRSTNKRSMFRVFTFLPTKGWLLWFLFF